ncbi:translation initiation factor IF3-1, mitochondrial-like [Henckelia pumila]|uniref:translation initiation factor IF3-1, mitochondrial-like n=1 Tax=Henckelia pumila TaxID=405737 RepID=UPI003C6E1B2F
MSMAFWTTTKQSKPKFHLIQKELKRCYTLNQAPSGVVNRRISSGTLIPELNSPDLIFRNSQLELFYSVRFFAAPAQANQKKEEVTSEPRLNEQITSHFIRLVSGEDHKVISRFDALGLAKNLKLDLVEVDRLGKPPVCKIFDFNKEKYLRQMKDKERAKSKTELKRGAFKEVRFAAKIKQKDLQMKADMVTRLMDSGHRVKCTAIEPTGDVDLETLLSRFSALIKDVAVEECEPKVEKKQAFVVVRHIKFGPKKGCGKKPTQASESTRNSSSKDSGSAPTARSPLEENGDMEEACLETGEVPDSEELLDKNAQTNKSEWTVFHDAEDLDTIFDIEDESHDLPRNDQSEIATSASSSGASSRPIPESARAHATSSTTTEVPKQGMVNRYSRDPRSRMSTSEWSSANNVPRIPTQAK